MTTTTFVSAFYNLQQRGVTIKTYAKELQDYFRRIDFLMSVPGPLVIFTEQEYVDTIVAAARQHRPSLRTEIVIKEWDKLYWVTRFDEILNVCKLRGDDSRMARTEHDDSPEFIPIMWEKFLFVKEVIDANKYATDSFAWIDFGLGRITHYGDHTQAFNVTSPKIRLMMTNQQIYTERYYQNDVQVSTCAAGYITGSAEYFTKLLNIFMAEANNCLTSLRCCPREESILSCLALKHPNLFDVYYGDENACMMTNYPGYYYASELLLHNLDRLIATGQQVPDGDTVHAKRCMDRALNVCDAVLHAFDNNATNLTATLLFVVLQAYLLASGPTRSFTSHTRNVKIVNRFGSYLIFDNFKAMYERNRSSMDALIASAVAKPINISIVCLIYKSVKYLQFVWDQVRKYTSFTSATGDREFFFVANDATPEVLEYLKTNNIPHYILNNESANVAAHGVTESYLNNVYRAWNFGASCARGKYVCFINSDMAFSPGWLEALIAKDPDTHAVTSRLLESGRYPSGTHGKTFNCGQLLRDYDERKFLSGAEAISEVTQAPSGLYMPLLMRKDAFESVGGYPEGNVVPGCDFAKPVIAAKGAVDCIPGDQVLMSKLATQGIQHITAFDSIVYHFQNGEMFE